MQGVILAAGKGTRLHPITATRSKAMVPIVGKPIVERVMDMLAANGVDDFILVIGPDDRAITQYFRRQSTIQADVRFVYQAERLGMAHALRQAAPLISETFIVSACDNLVATGDVAKVIARYRSEPEPNAVLTLLPVEPERIGSVGVVEMDGGWVTRIVEKPRPEDAPSDISSLPLYLFSTRILDYLPEVPKSPRGEYEIQDAIQMLIDRDRRVGGVIIQKRRTLTNAADLLALTRYYLSRDDDGSQIEPDAIGPNTRLTTPLCVEPGTVIGQNCAIGPNVYIERECRIGNDATIRDAVLLRGTTIEDGETVVNQVIV